MFTAAHFIYSVNLKCWWCHNVVVYSAPPLNPSRRDRGFWVCVRNVSGVKLCHVKEEATCCGWVAQYLLQVIDVWLSYTGIAVSGMKTVNTCQSTSTSSLYSLVSSSSSRSVSLRLHWTPSSLWTADRQSAHWRLVPFFFLSTWSSSSAA